MEDIIILGTGNHDIVRLIESINEDKNTYHLIGFLEKDKSKIGKDIYGYPILGDDELLYSEYKNCGVVVNIFQTPQLHSEVCMRLLKSGITNFPNIIAPEINTKFINIGKGNVIYENTSFGTHVNIGNFNLIYPLVLVGHETTIGDSNLLASKATIGSRARIGNRNLLSNASIVSNSFTVGDDNKIGVGAVVLTNVENDQSLLGNPAIESIEALNKAFQDYTPQELKKLFRIRK